MKSLRLLGNQFRTIRMFMLVGLLAVGLAATTTTPALAQTSGTWANTGSMNLPRAAHMATLLANGQVLVAGGNGSTAELYDPSTRKWTNTGSMNLGFRSGHTATLLTSGQVLVAGGVDGVDQPLNTAELYNPATGTWTVTGSMSTARGGLTATLLQNGRVLVAGGTDSSGSYLSSVELYNPATGTWTATGSMNHPRVGHTATLLANGQVLVAGGDGIGSISTAELYTPSTGSWTPTGNLNIGRFDAFATLLFNGDVLVLDGSNVTSATAYAEFYNPATGMWTLDGNNETPGNTGQTVTLLRTGMVQTCGGTQGVYPRPTIVRSACDLLDPSTGNDVLTKSMHTGRAQHSATVLPNGQVLVAGGQTQDNKGNWFVTNSAELYTP